MNRLKIKIKPPGFTLLEMIGVLAISSILISMMAPNIFRAIDAAFSTEEEENLDVLSNALRLYIQLNKEIPDDATATWVNAITTYTNLSPTDIEYNARNFRRALYFDPRFFTSTDTAFSGYTQSSGLTTAPVSPRAMFVSSLTANAPNAPTTFNDFEDIWNQDPSATIIEGEKVKISRLYLGNLFQELLLVNSNTQQSAYSLDQGTNTYPIPAAVGAIDGDTTVYVLNSTPVNLYGNPYPAGSLITKLTLNSGVSYRFEDDGGNWVWSRL